MNSVLLEDGRFWHHLRQSTIGNILRCPEQGRQIYLGLVEDDISTDSQVLGSAVHAGIEYVLYEKMNYDYMTPGDWEGDLAADVGHDVVEHYLDTNDWVYTKFSKAKVYELAHADLDVWVRDIEPLVEPVLIEETFKHVLTDTAERLIAVGGTIDCVDEDGVIWDWKTSHGMPHERWEKQRWSVQSTVYTWALNQMDPGLYPFPREFKFGIVNDTASEILSVWRDETHVSWLTEQCLGIARMLEADLPEWTKNDQGWWCSSRWCPVWQAGECKGGHMHEGWRSYEAPQTEETNG
jgi:hypothetical protein